MSPVFNGIVSIIDKLIPDPAARSAAAIKLRELERSGELAQITVNLEEARSESLFVAGWRPFIGWVCGSAFAYSYVILPLFDSFLNMPPAPDLSVMMPVLMGMLGLGGLRTYEKATGTNKNR